MVNIYDGRGRRGKYELLGLWKHRNSSLGTDSAVFPSWGCGLTRALFVERIKRIGCLQICPSRLLGESIYKWTVV